MTAMEPVDVVRSCPAGRYEDSHVVVQAGPAAGVSADWGPDGKIRVRHGWRAGELARERCVGHRFQRVSQAAR